MRPLAFLLLVACGSSESASAPIAPPVAALHEPVPTSPLLPCPTDLHSLGTGLHVERWPIATTPAAGGPPCIDVVRADATRFTLRVLSAADEAGARSAPGWRDAFRT